MMISNSKGKSIQIFDENVSLKKSGSKSSSKKRKPLATVDSNVINVAASIESKDTLKTPTRKIREVKTKVGTSAKDEKGPVTPSPIQALNESLFELVAESPRDIKIRELTRMVKAFKDDARCIRDIYAEEIESLRLELDLAKRSVESRPEEPTSSSEPARSSASGKISTLSATPKRPQMSVISNIERASSVGAQHAQTIISEAESIIAMAEAMLSVSNGSASKASPPVLDFDQNGDFLSKPSSSAREREHELELAVWKERVHELEAARSRDQQRMNEMEIVMKGMALKLEEYSKGSLADDWMKRVLQIFST